MIQHKIIELDKIETEEKGKPDDLLVCAASPEERCLGTVRKLDRHYKADNIILLKYSHPSKRREKHLTEMKAALVDRGQIIEFTIDEEKPILMINDIVDTMKRWILNCNSPSIKMDISTIIKWHLLIFLKAADIGNILNRITFLYTEPEEYITDLFQPLSFGISEIFPIPAYAGNFDFSKDVLLVLLLGYEGHRALALLENTNPADCLLFVPKPAYHKEWEGRTEEMNKEIINIVGTSRIRYIDSRNPLEVAKRLREILSDPTFQKYNILISPLGTKPQTLGLYLYVATRPSNTSLIYGAPLRHNDLFYSHGVGPTWRLPFKKLDIGLEKVLQ